MSEASKALEALRKALDDARQGLWYAHGSKVEERALVAVLKVVEKALATITKSEKINPCPYTQPHTREWCGYEECREN